MKTAIIIAAAWAFACWCVYRIMSGAKIVEDDARSDEQAGREDCW